MASNKFHIDLAALPAWQQAYIKQYKRVHNRDAGFVPTSNGWFELLREGKRAGRKFCYREADIVTMTEELEGESRFSGDDATKEDALPLALLVSRAMARNFAPA